MNISDQGVVLDIDIKKLRDKLNLNQGEFAKRIGVRRETVNRWETGQQRPRGLHVVNELRILEKRFYGPEEGS